MKTIIFLAALILIGDFSFAQSESVNNSSTVLSITLANFNGSFSDQQFVNLNWNTMMELNVDHFDIQRSGDGMKFQNIDSVESKMRINTNAYQLQYNYTDAKPLNGTSYYRIRVIGKDGHTTQSPVIRISNNITAGTKIYPTLVQNNMIYIESDENLQAVKMEFFDLSGNKISETNWTTLNGRENVQVSKTGKLHYGTYVARLTANGESIKNQLVIIQ